MDLEATNTAKIPAQKDTVLGSEILVEYELSSEDELIDQTPPGHPLRIVVGSGQLHPVIERYFVGRKPGEDFEVFLDPSVAFGESNPKLAFQISRRKLPARLKDIGVGATFEAPGPHRKLRIFRIVGADEKKIEVDGNHPLVGVSLRLKARILEMK